MPGGKQERRASRPLFFFVYMTTRNGDPRARGSFVMLYFFRHINNETAGAFLGCRELPAPRRAPELLNAPASNGTGYLFAHVTQNPPEKCTALYNQNERGEKL